ITASRQLPVQRQPLTAGSESAGGGPPRRAGQLRLKRGIAKEEMIGCPLDASQLEPRCRLRKKERFSRDARALSNGLSPGRLRRKRQEELVDDFCGDSLPENGRPTFMQKQAYPKLIGENLQHRPGTRGYRFAG